MALPGLRTESGFVATAPVRGGHREGAQPSAASDRASFLAGTVNVGAGRDLRHAENLADLVERQLLVVAERNRGPVAPGEA